MALLLQQTAATSFWERPHSARAKASSTKPSHNFVLSEPEAANDYDSPWKEALELYFEPALALLMPALHASVDWLKPVEFLDKEFQSLSHQLPSARRVVDKLARVSGLNGSPMVILIHIEVQGGKARRYLQSAMAERMTFYMFRIRDRFRSDFAGSHMALFSMAVLTNSVGGEPVLRQEWEFLGCSSVSECPVVHLGQWWNQWDRLEALAHSNPFAVVVMAQLLAHKHRGAERLVPKTQLVRLLYQYGYSHEAILSVMRLIDWMLTLPAAIEPDYIQAIRSIEQENTMAFVPSYERLAKAEGRAEGLAEGRIEGLNEGMLAIVKHLLSRRFGALPDWVEPRLQQASTDTLTQWSERILFADSLEDVFTAQN